VEVALVHLAEVLIIVFAIIWIVTLPFGFYRAYTRKLSLRWFLAIHVPVPFVFLTRVEAHLSYWYIPFTFLTCVAAQIVGSRIGRWWIARRAARGGNPQITPLTQSFSARGNGA
jgi:hypothetical protein